MKDELLKRYVDFLFDIGNGLEAIHLSDCPEIWANKHTTDNLGALVSGLEVSDDVANKLRDMWRRVKPEYFCFCCGTAIPYAFGKEVKSFIDESCNVLLEGVLEA